MGIIIKQSIKGSIWSYLGVGLGFITTAYLYPNYLSTDVIGLFGLLLSWSILLAQFFSFGFNGVTSRLFPYFRNQNNGHNGYLFILFILLFFGFGLFLLIFHFFSPWLVENNLNKSRLFSEYIMLIIPLTFFTLLFKLLDAFTRMLYNAVLGTFLIEFFQRALILILLALYILGLLNTNQLILAFATAVSLKGAILFIYLLFNGELKLKPNLNFVDKKLKNEMLSVAAFSILTSISSHLVFSLDKIIVNQIMGLSATGIYTITSFFGTLIFIPSRPLNRISGPLIAEAWKRNDIVYISDIYKRSCLNQFIIGAFLFGGIWINIDNIMSILGYKYIDGKWVIFFVGIGTLINMATGVNGLIISYSKYYRIALWFVLLQIAVFVGSMYLFTPLWGITGAGIAVAVSFIVNNLVRYIFLYRKFTMQPFTRQFWLVFPVFFISLLPGYLIPKLPLIIDFLIRSSLFAILFLIIVIKSGIASDINSTFQKIINQIKRRFRI